MNKNDMHEWVEQNLSAYIDGQLPANDRTRLEAHLAQCARCATSLATTRWTINLLKQVPAPALPRQFTLRVPEKPVRARPAWMPMTVGLSAATAFVLVLCVVATQFVLPRLGGFGAMAPAAAPPPPTVVSFAQPTAALLPAALPSTREGTVEVENVAPTEPPQVTPAVLQVTQPTVPAEVAPSGAPAPTPTAPAVPPQTQSKQMPQATGGQLRVKLFPPQPLGRGGGGEDTTRALRPTPTPAPTGPVTPVLQRGLVTGAFLNVRAGPGEDFPVLAVLKPGDRVNIIARDESAYWLYVEFPQAPGGYAWVAAQYISLQIPLDELPIARLVEPAPVPAEISPTPTPR